MKKSLDQEGMNVTPRQPPVVHLHLRREV
jgi:hypothetical protein